MLTGSRVAAYMQIAFWLCFRRNPRAEMPPRSRSRTSVLLESDHEPLARARSEPGKLKPPPWLRITGWGRHETGFHGPAACFWKACDGRLSQALGWIDLPIVVLRSLPQPPAPGYTSFQSGRFWPAKHNPGTVYLKRHSAAAWRCCIDFYSAHRPTMHKTPILRG